MIRIKEEFASEIRPGERYIGELPGPLKINLDRPRQAGMWTVFPATLQGKACRVRIAAIANWYLDGVENPGAMGATIIGLLSFPGQTSTSR